RTTEIPWLHRSGLLRRRVASCPGGTLAAFAAVSSFKKSIGPMTELLRGCVVCIRTRRSLLSNVIRLTFLASSVFLLADAAEAHTANQSHAALSRERVWRLPCANECLLRGFGEILLLWNPGFRSHRCAADLAANSRSSRGHCRIR